MQLQISGDLCQLPHVIDFIDVVENHQRFSSPERLHNKRVDHIDVVHIRSAQHPQK